ncbi:NfeD family protein, partial [Micrococcus endophyticus]
PRREVTVLRVEGATLVVRPLPQIDWEDGRS